MNQLSFVCFVLDLGSKGLNICYKFPFLIFINEGENWTNRKCSTDQQFCLHKGTRNTMGHISILSVAMILVFTIME